MKIDRVQGEMTLDNEVLGDQILKSFLRKSVHLINGIAIEVMHLRHETSYKRPLLGAAPF